MEELLQDVASLRAELEEKVIEVGEDWKAEVDAVQTKLDKAQEVRHSLFLH